MMNNNFELTLHVIFDFSETAMKAMKMFADQQTQPVEFSAPEPEPVTGKKTDTETKAEPQHSDKVSEMHFAPAGPEQETEPETKGLTKQNIREEINKTRSRIEGSDYKENSTSEGYIKYHRELTKEFKNISTLLGAEKPSALPIEQIPAFIEQCENLIINKDGELESQKAPY